MHNVTCRPGHRLNSSLCLISQEMFYKCKQERVMWLDFHEIHTNEVGRKFMNNNLISNTNPEFKSLIQACIFVTNCLDRDQHIYSIQRAARHCSG